MASTSAAPSATAAKTAISSTAIGCAAPPSDLSVACSTISAPQHPRAGLARNAADGNGGVGVIARVHDGDAVGVQAAPAGLAVERGHNPLVRSEESPGDVVARERRLDRRGIAVGELLIEAEHVAAIHVGPSVDEWPHLGEDQIAAEAVGIE